nr:ribonuclease H-like domain-containing protein [Tanacetum cinerariifolium]
MIGDDNHDGDHPETSNPSPPVPPQTQQISHTVSSSKLPILKRGKGLQKGYDRFQTLLSQLEIHGVGLDTLSFDDLYNNLRVFERNVKGTTTSSSSNTQNVAFMSADKTRSTNDINDDDMEEMDLKWQDDPRKALKELLIVDVPGSNGRITGKEKIKAGRLDFEDVYYVEELKHYNLFSVSQMCDKKNKVLFTDTNCLVPSPDFKLPDANQVLLKILRQHNMYSFNLKNIDPFRDLACLFAKASIDESNKWHKRLGYVNFKNLNKLVKGNLVRGLPSKIFENDHTYVACQKGKQHKASCKAKI